MAKKECELLRMLHGCRESLYSAYHISLLKIRGRITCRPVALQTRSYGSKPITFSLFCRHPVSKHPNNTLQQVLQHVYNMRMTAQFSWGNSSYNRLIALR